MLSLAAMDEDAPLPGKKPGEKAKQSERSEEERASPDFTIELESSDGATASAPVSRFAAIPPPLKEKFTKLDPMESVAYEKDWEPVLQTVRAPLAAFQVAPGKQFDPAKLRDGAAEIRPYPHECNLHQRNRFWTGGEMRVLVIALIVAAAALPAGAPAGFEHWTGAKLLGFEKTLSGKMNAHKIATESLGSYGNHSFLMAHREGDGEAELHETQNDVMVIESGEATLVVGGTVVDPRTTAPHEIRGPSIRGGEKVPVAAGDVLHIPVKIPHQMLVAGGKQITYFVVKIDAR